ncbi:MAG TPA: hypothetical protein VF110_14945 [Burkholderiales bacterium]
MRLTYDMVLADPDLLNRLLADARRERALAINRMVFAPVAALLRPAPARIAAALNAASS